MAEDKIYLTVDREKRQHENDGYIAILSRGSPQLGDKNIMILAVEIVDNMKTAKKWRNKMLLEQPWENIN